MAGVRGEYWGVKWRQLYLNNKKMWEIFFLSLVIKKMWEIFFLSLVTKKKCFRFSIIPPVYLKSVHFYMYVISQLEKFLKNV